MTDDGDKSSHARPVSLLAACSHCAMGRLCFPPVPSLKARALWPLANEQRIQVKRGEFLFHAGNHQVGIYAVKAGFLKTCVRLPDGRIKVVGFHAMGDVLGLGAFGRGMHTTDAIALNGCEVCVISLEKFASVLEDAGKAVHVRQLLACEITRVEAHAAVLGSCSAKQRVATFILEMSGRWDDRGYARTEFLLFMGRRDIGSFLGLTFETVSRTLSYFQSQQWISIHRKRLLIRNMSALQAQLTCAE